MKRRLYLLFLAGILLPGLILGYLSFRTIQDEKILVERTLENENREFAEEVDQLLQETKQTYLEQLKNQLRQYSSTSGPESFFLLTTELLENPMIQSLVLQVRGKIVCPLPLKPNPLDPSGTSAISNANLSEQSHELLAQVQKDFRQGNYQKCYKNLQKLKSIMEVPSAVGHLGSKYKYGLKILEIKCLLAMGKTKPAAEKGKALIRQILGGSDFANYHQMRFYLRETIRLLTSMEELPRETRNYFWMFHQRLETYFANAEFISKEWDLQIDAVLMVSGEAKPIRTSYLAGSPYMIIGYPWTDKDARVVARLNESIFLETLNEELVKTKKSSWNNVDFVIVNEKGRVIIQSDSIGTRPISLEKSIGEGFPDWKLMVFKKPQDEISALGRRKIFLLYILLSFALAALVFGSASIFLGLHHQANIFRMKGNFLSAISHELKTPLTAIRMYSEMLETGKKEMESRRKQYAGLIGKESLRLQGMIDDILNFTRLENGSAKLNFENVDLSQLIQEVTGLMSGSFQKSGIELKIDAEKGVHVYGDYPSLRSVLQNLLDNALKYSPRATTVLVDLKQSESNVILKVSDQGFGISASDQKRIFEKFYRAGDEMTRKAKGSGLGLALVKQILDHHSARISVHSRLREGTQMEVVFPREKKNV